MGPTESAVQPAIQGSYPEWYESSTYTGKVFHVPGLRLPTVKPADEAPLPDETPVIGVVIEGSSRAYLPQAMEDFSTHVINDRIGDVPVTVTYCTMLKCVRVFTRMGETGPLDVALGGLHMGRMALEIDGERFAQDASNLPVDDLDYLRTTWGQWKTSHPDTDVFVGLVLDDVAVGVD